MINGFEKETHDLSQYEISVLVPQVVEILKNKIGKQNSITNDRIREIINQHKVILTDSRLRKIIHYIRIKGLVKCLIATNKGYYISNDVEEFMSYIDSLTQRENSIRSIRYALLEQEGEVFNDIND